MINYTSYVAQISNLMVFQPADPNFTTMLPGMIDFAEQKMYRELDLLATRVTDTSATLTAGVHTLSLPVSMGTFLVVEQVNVITPATATSSYGTRNPLVNTSVDVIDITYPSQIVAQNVPEFFAMKDNATILLGPTPDQNYAIEIRGTQRPVPLSATNPTTILTTMLPDAFIAASMIFGAGFMRDFGAQSDNPQMAASWDAQYGKLIQSANVEELRKKYQSQGWTSQIPAPTATPPRV